MNTLFEAAKAAADLLQEIADAEGDVYDFFHHRDMADRYFQVMQALQTALKTYREDVAHDMKQTYEIGVEDGRELERDACVRFVSTYDEALGEVARELKMWSGQ